MLEILRAIEPCEEVENCLEFIKSADEDDSEQANGPSENNVKDDMDVDEGGEFKNFDFEEKIK